jgi:hypothetical protein
MRAGRCRRVTLWSPESDEAIQALCRIASLAMIFEGLRKLQDRRDGSDRDHEHGPEAHGHAQCEDFERGIQVAFR